MTGSVVEGPKFVPPPSGLDWILSEVHGRRSPTRFAHGNTILSRCRRSRMWLAGFHFAGTFLATSVVREATERRAAVFASTPPAAV